MLMLMMKIDDKKIEKKEGKKETNTLYSITNTCSPAAYFLTSIISARL